MAKNYNKVKNFFFGKRHYLGIIILIFVIFGLLVDSINANNDKFFKSIIRLDRIIEKIHKGFVVEIDPEDLADNAIKGMLEILDPHTNYLKPKAYKELRINTEGEFGGLGIQISIREKILTVATPISGTPAWRAGVQSGDRIIKINEKSTEGITIEKAVELLRGDPGSEVKITIKREGELKPLEFNITRSIIKLKSVPYYGVLEGNIGYIHQVQFSKKAGKEVENAIRDLLKQDIKGLIFDLRNNPGGLLTQAIEIAGKFLPKKSIIVSTRGRMPIPQDDSYLKSDPILPKDIHLIILVNAASASASEIVAGAIQDWDRGIILGDTTFGKGSVQTIFNIDNDNINSDRCLKMTTAFYYTPSGRCINRDINSIRGKKKKEEIEEKSDSTEAHKDSINQDSTVYWTKGGRRVYGGGGIIPDTIVENFKLKQVVRALLFKDVFFRFANYIYPSIQKEHIVIDSSFSVDDKLIEMFNLFLDSINFEYKSFARVKLEDYKKWTNLIKDTTEELPDKELVDLNLSENELSEMSEEVKQIEDILLRVEKREFEENRKIIKRFIRDGILVRGLGQDSKIVYSSKLAYDSQVLSAIKILSNDNIYSDLLEPDEK